MPECLSGHGRDYRTRDSRVARSYQISRHSYAHIHYTETPGPDQRFNGLAWLDFK